MVRYRKSSKMEYFVDYQAFVHSVNCKTNKYIIKELAIVPIEGEHAVYLFKPPYNWSKLSPRDKTQNSWLERNYTHLRWESGNHDYSELKEILQFHLSDAKIIWMNAPEKVKCMKIFYPDKVYQLENFPSLKILKKYDNPTMKCSNHYNNDTNCALRNTLIMKKWVLLERRMEYNHESKE